MRNQDGGSGGSQSGRVNFAELRGRVVTELGWTFEQFGDADFGYLMELYDYWLQFPPMHVLLRNRFGYEGPAVSDAEAKEVLSSPDMMRMAAAYGDGHRAKKIKDASPLEQNIFAMQREQAKKKGKRAR